MARRRINTNFVIGSAVAAVVAGGGAAAFYKFRPKDPVRFMNAAEMHLKAGQIPEATAALNRVAMINPTDPTPHLRLAKIYWDQRTRDFGTNVKLATAEWTRAVELDRNSKEAWRGLLDANMAWVVITAQQMQSRQTLPEFAFQLPRQFAVARDAARHLLALDPNDSKARAAVPQLTINLWLLNLPIPQPADTGGGTKGGGDNAGKSLTDAQQVAAAVTELTNVLRDHPEDADLPYWIARAKIGQAVRMANQASSDALNGVQPAGGGGGDRPDATAVTPAAGAQALFHEAAVVFDDPIARRPTDATLAFRKYEILSALVRIDPTPAATADYVKGMRDALDRAQANVARSDPGQYTSYKMAWADFLSRTDPARGEAVYKELLANPPPSHAAAALAAAAAAAATQPAAAAGAKPPAPGPQPTDAEALVDDMAVRINYARLLERDVTRRNDALAVLDPIPRTVPLDLPVVNQPDIAQRLAGVRLLRATILTDQMETTGNTAQRDKLSRQAADEIAAAEGNAAQRDDYELAKARGRLQLVAGQVPEAIVTLTAAADRLAASGRGIDYQLLGWQATAYARGGQTGKAIDLLRQAVKNPAAGSNRQPHQMLAQMYLEEQDYDDARQQVAWLVDRYPDDLQTVMLQLAALGRDPDAKAVAPLYARLPEQSVPDQLQKAGWAARTKNPADAQRLMYAVLKQLPGDPGVSLRLAQMLKADGKLGDANDVLDKAIAAHPEKKDSLDIGRVELNGGDAALVNGMAKEAVAHMGDPFARAIAEYHLAQTARDVPGQIAALERAVQLKPDAREPLNDLFVLYLQTKAFDKARGMLPAVSANDIDHAKGAMFTFKLAQAQGDAKLAVTLGRQLTNDYPQFASSWECLGEAQQADGQLEAACQQYTAALDRQGNNPAAIQRLVDCTIRLGRLDDARRIIKDARKKYPDDPFYREQQVRVELAYGDPEAVLGIVDDAVRLHPEDARGFQIAIQVYAAAAQRQTAKGNPDKAAVYNDKVRALLTDALKRNPAEIVFAAQLAEVQAQDHSPAGLAAAAATFDGLRQTDKWRASPLPDVMLGRLYLLAGRPADGERTLRRAMATDPRNADARSLLADALVAQKRPAEALDVLAPAKADPALRSKYVDLMLAQNKGPAVIAELTAEAKANPADPVPGNLLAHVYAVQGKWDDALAMADRTLAASPDDTAAYYVRGTTLLDRPKPDYDRAAADLAVFRQAFPTNLQGRLALARALEAKGDGDGATKELEAAASIAPDDRTTRLRLVRAYLQASPTRTLDAQRVISQTLTMPALAHDVDVQRVAALVWLQAGDNARAVASIRDAMANATDQRALLDEYFNVLLRTGNYDLLLDESAKFITDAKTPWTVYDYRGQARAKSNDPTGAYADFTTALDIAGTSPSVVPAVTVANHIGETLGAPRAIEMVRDRAQNSPLWKLVLAGCYQRAGDTDKALTADEGAMAAADRFAPADRRTLMKQTASLYILANPPQADKAVPLLQAVLKESPDDLDALNNMACTLSEGVTPPRPADALAYSTRAYDLVRKSSGVNSYVFDTQGWMLILAGRVDEGIDVLHKVVDAADFPDAHYHLAQGYIRKNMPEDAKRELNAATRIFVEATAAHRPIDQSMKGKVLAAQKQVDEMIGKSLNDKAQAGVTPG